MGMSSVDVRVAQRRGRPEARPLTAGDGGLPVEGVPLAAGFTLIELMIALVIVAILVAIAYPMYTHYVEKSRRSAAVTALQRAATAEEKYYAVNNVYTTSLKNLGYTNSATATTVPVPSAAKDWYVLTVPSAGTSSYAIEAKPKGVQANDACGTYKLKADGTQTVLNATRSVTSCWGGG